jgi:hypothetical protein
MKVIQTHLTIGLVDRDVDASSTSTSGIIWPPQVACDGVAHSRPRARRTGGELFRILCRALPWPRRRWIASRRYGSTAGPVCRSATAPLTGGSGTPKEIGRRGACAPSTWFRPRIKLVPPKNYATVALPKHGNTWAGLPTESHCYCGTRVDPLHRLQYNPQQNSVRHSQTKQQIECSYQSTARFDRESRTIVLSRKTLTGWSYVFQETLWRGAKSANQAHRVGAARCVAVGSWWTGR